MKLTSLLVITATCYLFQLTFDYQCHAQIKNSLTRKSIQNLDTTVSKFWIGSNKAYFSLYPNGNAKTHAYLVKGQAITPQKKQNNYYYLEYKNSTNQITKGWISVHDVYQVDSTFRKDKSIREVAVSTQDTNQNKDQSQIVETIPIINHSLTFENLLTILTLPYKTKYILWGALMRQNNQWKFAGTDYQNGDRMFRTDKTNTREFIDWHFDNNILEYITLNPQHFQLLLKEMSLNGYRLIKQSTHAGQTSSTYAYNSVVVQVTKVKLQGHQMGYKFYLGRRSLY